MVQNGQNFDENDKIFKNTQKIKNLALQVLDNIILHYLAKFQPSKSFFKKVITNFVK